MVLSVNEQTQLNALEQRYGKMSSSQALDVAINCEVFAEDCEYASHAKMRYLFISKMMFSYAYLLERAVN